ncbi:hypothetical protein KIW84_075338 [Lathyrus oleraceus]|uniref:Uncharacterized protein n=1 Tax=Pisum sativum TaxID=3888 RepID=A0A9D4VUP3_PEA|nr:hypothetical protein KIW84_075338 [Pisum sativum]
MVEISQFDEANMLEQTGESPYVDIAEVYPRVDEDLVDFLYRCKNKGSQVCLCPRGYQNERGSKRVVGNNSTRPKSYVPSASAARGTWIKPQERQDTPQGVVADTRGGLAVNYRREFKI